MCGPVKGKELLETFFFFFWKELLETLQKRVYSIPVSQHNIDSSKMEGQWR